MRKCEDTASAEAFYRAIIANNHRAIYGAFVDVDGTVTPLGKEAMEAGIVAIKESSLKLEPGKAFDLPHGTEIQWPDPKGGPVKSPGLYALTPKAEAAVRAFVESVPLTQEAISAGGAALEREIERSFGEPLDAVPDQIADQRAQAVRRVIEANTLLAQAVEVLGAEAVELLLESLAAPALEAAA